MQGWFDIRNKYQSPRQVKVENIYIFYINILVVKI